MNSQFKMLMPILGGLNKINQESVPRILNETLETVILLLINHLDKKTPLAAPMEKLDHQSESKLAYIPTVTWKGGVE
jgi:hypothetical protein